MSFLLGFHEVAKMVAYKVFYKNFELKKGEFMGMLIERRKDMRGKTQIESGMRWANAQERSSYVG